MPLDGLSPRLFLQLSEAIKKDPTNVEKSIKLAAMQYTGKGINCVKDKVAALENIYRVATGHFSKPPEAAQVFTWLKELSKGGNPDASTLLDARLESTLKKNGKEGARTLDPTTFFTKAQTKGLFSATYGAREQVCRFKPHDVHNAFLYGLAVEKMFSIPTDIINAAIGLKDNLGSPEAVEWLKEKARHYETDGSIFNALGQIYLKGLGGNKPDKDLAIEYYKIAADSDSWHDSYAYAQVIKETQPKEALKVLKKAEQIATEDHAWRMNVRKIQVLYHLIQKSLNPKDCENLFKLGTALLERQLLRMFSHDCPNIRGPEKRQAFIAKAKDKIEEAYGYIIASLDGIDVIRVQEWIAWLATSGLSPHREIATIEEVQTKLTRLLEKRSESAPSV